MEDWRPIEGFPDYALNINGEVLNVRQDRIIKPFFNQRGHAMVGLYLGPDQITLSVARLVAAEFLELPTRSFFNTLIHKDGNKGNAAATNLAWRPRHFAIRYHQQFENFRQTGKLHPAGFDVPIYEERSDKDYKSTTHAALEEGLLEIDVVLSVLNNIPARPFGHRFYYA